MAQLTSFFSLVFAMKKRRYRKPSHERTKKPIVVIAFRKLVFRRLCEWHNRTGSWVRFDESEGRWLCQTCSKAYAKCRRAEHVQGAKERIAVRGAEWELQQLFDQDIL